MNDDTQMAVRIPGDIGRFPSNAELLLMVDDPELGTVRVRWRIRDGRYRCTACGTYPHAYCIHAKWAAIHLAERVLGVPYTASPDPTMEGPTR